MSFKQGRGKSPDYSYRNGNYEKNKLVNTNQIDSSTFAKANRFKKGDVIDFEYELNSLLPLREITRSRLNSVDGFYDREEFNNTSLKENWSKILCN
jgi:hypothetical protein